jgi:hypothetical protein
MNGRVAMCLKCTKGQRLFYARHGFKVVRKQHIPSPNLFAVVPKSKMAAQPPDTFLICMAKTTPEATEPNLSEAASVLAHLKDPPPSPPEVTAHLKDPPPSPPEVTAHLKDPPPSPPESTDSDTKGPPVTRTRRTMSQRDRHASYERNSKHSTVLRSSIPPPKIPTVNPAMQTLRLPMAPVTRGHSPLATTGNLRVESTKSLRPAFPKPRINSLNKNSIKSTDFRPTSHGVGSRSSKKHFSFLGTRSL